MAMTKKAVIVTKDELKELVETVRRLAMVYGILGYNEDKNSLYALIDRFKTRLKQE
jgi:hypothetical protein